MKKTFKSTLILCLILIVGQLFPFALFYSDNEKRTMQKSFNYPLMQKNSRNPFFDPNQTVIYVNPTLKGYQWSDQDFFSGKGTENDPYRIEGLTLNLTEKKFGILIEDSQNVHFIINDTRIYNHEGLIETSAIKINNCSMGRIGETYISNAITGIRLEDSTNIVIENNTFNNNAYGIYTLSSDFCDILNNHFLLNDNAVRIEDSAFFNVKNNNFSNQSKNGLVIERGRSFQIIDNLFQYNLDNGLFIKELINSQIRRNSAFHNTLDGIVLAQLTNCIIQDNTCKNNKQSGIYYGNSELLNITHNRCESNLNGLEVYASNDININQNNFNNNRFGIFLELADYHNITNNTLNNNQYGIYLKSCENIAITNNTFQNNEYELYYYNPTSWWSIIIAISIAGIIILITTLIRKKNKIYKKYS